MPAWSPQIWKEMDPPPPAISLRTSLQVNGRKLFLELSTQKTDLDLS